MKIYMMKLKKELRITIDGTKQDLKKGHEIIAFTLAEYSKFAPYANTKIVDVDNKKFLNLVKTNLKKLDGVETDLSSIKPGQDEADARYQAELDRREALVEETEAEEETTEEVEDIEDEESEEVEETEETTEEVEEETTEEVDPFKDEEEKK